MSLTFFLVYVIEYQNLHKNYQSFLVIIISTLNKNLNLGMIISNHCYPRLPLAT